MDRSLERPARPTLAPPLRGASVHRLPAPSPDVESAEPGLASTTAAFAGFLRSLGLDLDDADLAGTPRRVARAYQAMLAGLDPDEEPRLSTFPNTEGYAGIVGVTDVPFYSLCAHHFLPFFGAVHVGYVPGERLVGLSKLARAVDFCSRRPQLQERLTEQIASLIDQRLAPAGTIVAVEARHLCMEMRGVAKPGVTTTTTSVRGTFADPVLQAQFFARLPGSGGRAAGEEVRP